MARRAFLHLGTAKSGTTYLQELWWRHRDRLRERGLLLPGVALRDHFHAAALVKQMPEIVSGLDPEELLAWQRLLEESRAWSGDVLISHEHFSDSPADAAARARAELQDVADEVHLVLTVRDLVRVLPSAWQQRVKQGSPQGFEEFLATARDGGQTTTFWRYQDVPGILRRWVGDLPPEHVHLVVVPGPGAPRDELWRRTGAVLGVQVDDLDTTSRRPNESLGLVETELLRRVNTRVPAEARTVALRRLTKGEFSRDVLAGSGGSEPWGLPGQHLEWVRSRAADLVARLQERPYDVVGDLADLLPAPAASGRVPAAVGTDELLRAATTVVARMVDQATAGRG